MVSSKMMRRVLRCALRPCCLLTLLVGGALPCARQAFAQSAGDADRPGPTRASVSSTAAALADHARDATPVQVLPRFFAFQRRFQKEFGDEPSAKPVDGEEAVQDLEASLAARWGDSALLTWLQRGLALYARVAGYTEVQHKGFDMKVNVDDMPEGKVGVRVNRALE